ncbi:hypothetical protein BDQ17DRAFT_1470690 [Cyathus striatus]|nr:hypothetical protein BDQ17DRAFT_1470690 [Cyathus striatus]
MNCRLCSSSAVFGRWAFWEMEGDEAGGIFVGLRSVSCRGRDKLTLLLGAAHQKDQNGYTYGPTGLPRCVVALWKIGGRSRTVEARGRSSSAVLEVRSRYDRRKTGYLVSHLDWRLLWIRGLSARLGVSGDANGQDLEGWGFGWLGSHVVLCTASGRALEVGNWALDEEDRRVYGATETLRRVVALHHSVHQLLGASCCVTPSLAGVADPKDLCDFFHFT